MVLESTISKEISFFHKKFFIVIQNMDEISKFEWKNI